MADPWAYVGPYFNEALSGSPVTAQARWTFEWTSMWAAQGQVNASVDHSNDGHVYILEGDLGAPEHGGPYGRWGYENLFTFMPMHLRVAYDAVEGTTRASVTNTQNSESQDLDNPFLNPFLEQVWLPEQGNRGIVGIAFFDRWDSLSYGVAAAMRGMSFRVSDLVGGVEIRSLLSTQLCTLRARLERAKAPIPHGC